MAEDYCIHALFLKHIDVLALLDLIGYIVDDRLVFFFLLCVLIICFVVLCLGIRIFYGSTICLDTVFQCQILVIQILEQNRVFHLVTELFIFQASELDERTDVIPVFLIVFSLCLAHSGKLVCNLLGNVFRDLIHKSVIL